jgi:hypothetical protein
VKVALGKMMILTLHNHSELYLLGEVVFQNISPQKYCSVVPNIATLFLKEKNKEVQYTFFGYPQEL